MAHRTVPAPTAAEDARSAPPDIDTMRVTIGHALAETPQPHELDTLARTLRGHIEVLIPDVEALAARQPKKSVPRACAMACVGEARGKLRIGMGDTDLVRLAVVERLARSTKALCDHYERMGGQP